MPDDPMNEEDFPTRFPPLEDELTFSLHNVAASHGLAEQAAQEILRLRRVAQAVDDLSEDEFADHPDIAAAMDALHEPGWLGK